MLFLISIDFLNKVLDLHFYSTPGVHSGNLPTWEQTLQQ